MRHGTYSHAPTKEETGMSLCKIKTHGAKEAHPMGLALIGSQWIPSWESDILSQDLMIIQEKKGGENQSRERRACAKVPVWYEILKIVIPN